MSRLTDEQHRELEQLPDLPDTEIDTSDIPEARGFRNPVRGRFYRPTARSIRLRIDGDLLDWLDAKSEAVQAHVNTALRD